MATYFFAQPVILIAKHDFRREKNVTNVYEAGHLILTPTSPTQLSPPPFSTPIPLPHIKFSTNILISFYHLLLDKHLCSRYTCNIKANTITLKHVSSRASPSALAFELDSFSRWLTYTGNPLKRHSSACFVCGIHRVPPTRFGNISRLSITWDHTKQKLYKTST